MVRKQAKAEEWIERHGGTEEAPGGQKSRSAVKKRGMDAEIDESDSGDGDDADDDAWDMGEELEGASGEEGGDGGLFAGLAGAGVSRARLGMSSVLSVKGRRLRKKSFEQKGWPHSEATHAYATPDRLASAGFRRVLDACGGRGGDGVVMEETMVGFAEWGHGDDPARIAAEHLEGEWGGREGGVGREGAAQLCFLWRLAGEEGKAEVWDRSARGVGDVVVHGEEGGGGEGGSLMPAMGEAVSLRTRRKEMGREGRGGGQRPKWADYADSEEEEEEEEGGREGKGVAARGRAIKAKGGKRGEKFGKVKAREHVVDRTTPNIKGRCLFPLFHQCTSKCFDVCVDDDDDDMMITMTMS